ncbi:MAG: hypothetical protein HDQ87_11835 [Clostridia bacterium]|nr:hypothetical protein [Clostridia bacterium]
MPNATEYLFVNGKDPDQSTLLGRIVADILEPDPDLIQTEVRRRRMKRLKNTAERRTKMEDLLARYVDERSAEKANQEMLGLLHRMADRKKLTPADAAEEAEMSWIHSRQL